MNFSPVNFTPYKGTNKSSSAEIELGQSLQAFLANSAITLSPSRDLDKVSVVPLAPGQDERSHQQLSFFTPEEPASTVPIPPWPSCGSTQAKQIAGTGPHHAGLRCISCDRFIKWLAHPKGELSSNEGGQH